MIPIDVAKYKADGYCDWMKSFFWWRLQRTRRCCRRYWWIGALELPAKLRRFPAALASVLNVTKFYFYFGFLWCTRTAFTLKNMLKAESTASVIRVLTIKQNFTLCLNVEKQYLVRRNPDWLMSSGKRRGILTGTRPFKAWVGACGQVTFYR